jgi:hypothetical protein
LDRRLSRHWISPLEFAQGPSQQPRRALGSNNGPVYCVAIASDYEHRSFPSLKILDVVQVAEIAACRHPFDGAVDGSRRLEGAL